MPVEVINHHVEITDVVKFITEKNASCYRVTTCKVQKQTSNYHDGSSSRYYLHVKFESCSNKHEEHLALKTLDPTIDPFKCDSLGSPEAFKNIFENFDPTGQTKYYVSTFGLEKTPAIHDNEYIEMPGL